MNYNESHVQLLTRYGYTDRGARFLWLVAHFSGVFLRSQIHTFFGNDNNYPAQTLIDNAIDHRHIRGYDEGRKLVRYHLYSKPIYRQLEQPNSNYRRDASPSLNRIRLYALDYVLAHLDDNYLLTEHDKTSYFTEKLGLSPDVLPGKSFGHPTLQEGTFVRFVDKAPLSVSDSGEIRFVYVDETSLSQAHFESHLDQYAALFAALTVPWTLTLVTSQDARVGPFERAFTAKFLEQGKATGPDPKLLRYFELCQQFDSKQFGKLGQTGLVERAELAKFLDTPTNRTLYDAWTSGKPLPATQTKAQAPCRFTFSVTPTAYRHAST